MKSHNACHIIFQDPFHPFEHDWPGLQLLHNLSYPLNIRLVRLLVVKDATHRRCQPILESPSFRNTEFYTNFVLIYFVCHSCAAHIFHTFFSSFTPSTTMTGQPIFILCKYLHFFQCFSSPLPYISCVMYLFFKFHILQNS